MSGDPLGSLAELARTNLPLGRDLFIVAIAAHAARSSADIPAPYDTAWQIAATIAGVYGLASLVWRSWRSYRGQE